MEQYVIKGGNPPVSYTHLDVYKRQDNFFGPNVIELCRMADIVFMALHGENGENGKIQAAFDLFGIRYTGTGYLGSALAMNKGMAKQLFLENGIPTPRGTSLKRGEDAAKIETCGIHFPCVVKPCSGGSSIGVSIVHDKAEYEQALKEAFRWENEDVYKRQGWSMRTPSGMRRIFRKSGRNALATRKIIFSFI